MLHKTVVTYNFTEAEVLIGLLYDADSLFILREVLLEERSGYTVKELGLLLGKIVQRLWEVGG